MNKLKITRSDGSTHETVPVKQWRQRCRCECKTGGQCEHDFSGTVVYTKNSGSVVCRHCGLSAMAHDEQITKSSPACRVERPCWALLWRDYENL